MTPFRRCPSAKISSVVSDVDGTLVTTDKVLTASIEAAVAELQEIAVIDDGCNDIAMSERNGLGIAMGNAAFEVQSATDLVTDSNRDDGVAHAIERFVLGGDRLNARGNGMHAGDCV